MQCGFEFGLKYFFSFTSACHCNPFVILVLSFLRRPRAPSFAARIVLLCIPAQFCRKFDAWLEIDLELIADRLEAASLIFFVAHAIVWLDAMGLLAVVFLAMGTRVLLWLIILGLLFFFFSRALAFLGFLCSRSRDLHCSSEELLSELAP
jgi:hypothetical protein